MKRTLSKIMVVLLVPALMLDPVVATALGPSPAASAAWPLNEKAGALYGSNALGARLLAVHPSTWRGDMHLPFLGLAWKAHMQLLMPGMAPHDFSPAPRLPRATVFSEVQGHDLSALIADELRERDPRIEIKSQAQLTYEAQTFTFELWGRAIPRPDHSHILFARVGYLFFMRAETAESLSPEMREALGPNLILVLPRSTILNPDMCSYTAASMVPALAESMGGYHSVDLGAAEGTLAVVDARRGATSFDLVEKLMNRVYQARQHLPQNGIPAESAHYIPQDLTRTQSVLNQLSDPDKDVVVHINLGRWEFYPNISNETGLAIVRQMPRTRMLIVGGYHVLNHADHRDDYLRERAAARALGFETDPRKVVRIKLENGVEFPLCWVGVRKGPFGQALNTGETDTSLARLTPLGASPQSQERGRVSVRNRMAWNAVPGEEILPGRQRGGGRPSKASPVGEATTALPSRKPNVPLGMWIPFPSRGETVPVGSQIRGPLGHGILLGREDNVVTVQFEKIPNPVRLSLSSVELELFLKKTWVLPDLIRARLQKRLQAAHPLHSDLEISHRAGMSDKNVYRIRMGENSTWESARKLSKALDDLAKTPPPSSLQDRQRRTAQVRQMIVEIVDVYHWTDEEIDAWLRQRSVTLSPPYVREIYQRRRKSLQDLTLRMLEKHLPLLLEEVKKGQQARQGPVAPLVRMTDPVRRKETKRLAPLLQSVREKYQWSFFKAAEEFRKRGATLSWETLRKVERIPGYRLREIQIRTLKQVLRSLLRRKSQETSTEDQPGFKARSPEAVGVASIGLGALMDHRDLILSLVVAAFAIVIAHELIRRAWLLGQRAVLSERRAALREEADSLPAAPPIPFSKEERQRAIDAETLHTEVLVLGIGAAGASTAAHAAQLGLPTVLVGAGDFSEGASGNNTSLAHAGIRYVAKGWIRYVLHEAREVFRLKEIAPHWVEPFGFILLVFAGGRYGMRVIQVGVKLYERLFRWAAWSLGKRDVGEAISLSPDEVQTFVPSLKKDQLLGGFLYPFDARLRDARFTLGFAQQAAARGVTVINHARAIGFVMEPDLQRPMGVLFDDELEHRRFTIFADVIVNATGPWIDEVRRLIHPDASPLLSNSLGIHLVVERIEEKPLIFPLPDDRVFFVLPMTGGRSLVGTTEKRHDGAPDEARATEEGVRELVDHLFEFFPTLKPEQARPEDAFQRYVKSEVRQVYWGLRPLPNQSGPTSRISRDFALVKEGRLWSILGMKLTAARAVGENVARHLWKARRGSRPQAHGLEPLPGGHFSSVDHYVLLARLRYPHQPIERLEYLIRHYGSYYQKVLSVLLEDSHFALAVLPDQPWVLAEVAYAARYEMVLTLNDFLWRRSRWAREAEIPYRQVREIAAILRAELGWSAEETERQVQDYFRELDAHRPSVITLSRAA